MQQKNIKNFTKGEPAIVNCQLSKVENGMSRSKCGFTLVEVMVAMLIFAMVMVMLSGSFASFFNNYVAEKKSQSGFENAQYALNLMAKSLRTSSLLSLSSSGSSSWTLYTYDYSQTKCILYKYATNELQIATTTDTAASITDCVWAHAGGYNVLTTNDVVGASINAVASNSAATPAPTFGQVTIALSIKEPGQTAAGLPIQLTVSLRSGS